MKKISLKEQVYRSLRNDILFGAIPGGTRLIETEEATRLSVSRTPVREALQRLAQESFVRAIPRAGYLVEDLPDDEIQDLFSTRMDVEGAAVRRAVRTISVEELKELDDNLEKARIAAKSKDFDQMAELDRSFHIILYKAARSRHLYRICRNMSDLTSRYRYGLHQQTDLANDSLNQHLQIYQAVIAKDGNAAANALVTHGESACRHLADLMKRQRSQAFDRDEF